MSKLEGDTVQLMYEHQTLMTPNGDEYIVRGAEVFCGWGEKSCVLNLVKDHGEATEDNRPLITIKDSRNSNVKGFGYCNLIKGVCSPLLSEWSNGCNDIKKIYDASSGKAEYGVIRSATAICGRTSNGEHGIVAFSSSGQTIPDFSNQKIVGEITIIENVKGSWRRNVNDGNDFLGHINVNYDGFYNLGLFVTNNSSNYIGGSVFLYEKKGVIVKKLKYIGAYQLYNHTSEKLEGFKDYETIIYIPSDSPSYEEKKQFYWTIWATLELNKNTDYYVEIDCPDIDAYDYKLICYQLKETLAEKVNRVMCCIDSVMNDTNSTISMIYQAIDDSNKLNCVVAIGLNGALGSNLYAWGSVQLVVDLHGNVGIQLITGAGALAGASAKGMAYVAIYPGVDKITDLEGFGGDMGGSAGEVFVGGLAALYSGEGDEAEFNGIMVGLGLGANGTVGEGHVSMGNTFPTIKLGNIVTGKWDDIYQKWKMVYSLWYNIYPNIS